MVSAKTKEAVQLVANNRKAFHEYIIEDTLEAGLVLAGSEIKSIRAGRVNISDAFVSERAGEMWLLNMNISKYDQASYDNHEPLRPRKLLLHKYEIRRWAALAQQKGYTIVVLKLYLKQGRAKVELGLAKGKKLFDKRQALAERETKRRIDRDLSDYRKGRA